MNFKRSIIFNASVVLAAICLAGCASDKKRLEPVPAPPLPPLPQPAPPPQRDPQVLRDIRVAQQPELEPEWADYVKDYYPSWRRHYWVDRGQWGNRGYIGGSPITVEQPGATTEATLTPLPPVAPTIIEPLTIKDEVKPVVTDAEAKPTKYIVTKGDSLWKIAGKIYRNPLKWPRIYRANKDKIKNPNKIYIGQVLIIPQD